jgi:hypothetical protein
MRQSGVKLDAYDPKPPYQISRGEGNRMNDVSAAENEKPRIIDSIWAFLSIDDDGNESVIAAPLMGPGSYVPLISSDQRRLESFTVIAEAIARDTGRMVHLVKFTSRKLGRRFDRSNNDRGKDSV